MTASPLVSIITPAYNAAAHIGRTIDSVLAQTLSRWEWLIIDDGSTDGTDEIVGQIPDPRVRCERQDNQGAGAARNLGIARSTGQYVIFLDSDDWWDPRCLEVLAQALDRNPSCAVAHADWAFVSTEYKAGGVQSSAFSKGPGLNTLALFNPIAMHSAMVRRGPLLAIGGFPVLRPTLEDWAMWLRLAKAGCSFVHIPRLLAFYFWRPGSKGKDVVARKADRLATLEWLWAQDGLPEGLRASRARSFATAHLDFCVCQFGLGHTELALQEMDAAIVYEPSTAAEVDTFYRLAYAGDRPDHLDEIAASSRTDLILAHIASMTPEVDIRASQYAAHFALGMASYRDGSAAFARRHFAQALRCQPAALANPRFGGFAARALLPRFLIEAGRQLKRRAQPGAWRHG